MSRKKKAFKPNRHWCDWNQVECSNEVDNSGYCKGCKQVMYILSWKEELWRDNIISKKLQTNE